MFKILAFVLLATVAHAAAAPLPNIVWCDEMFIGDKLYSPYAYVEEELEVALFERSRREVRLTAAGEAFRLRAERVLREVEAAAEEARRASKGQLGVLRVAHTSHAALTTLPGAVAAFTRSNPQVEVQLREMPSNRQIEALRRAEVDVGVVGWPEAKPGVELIGSLEPQHLVLLLPAEHARAAASGLSFGELTGDTHIILPRAHEPRIYDAWAHAFSLSGGADPQIVEVGQVMTVVALVAAGLGVDYAPSQIAGFCPEGVRVVAHRPHIPVHFGVMVREGEHAVLVREFVRELMP